MGRHDLGLATAAIALLMLGPGLGRADDRLKLNLVLDGRLVSTPPTRGFLDLGLGKTRYGHAPRAVQVRLAQAALLGRFELRPDLTIRVHANADAEHNFNRRVDVVEALLRYAPTLSDSVSLDFRAGLFFPTLSLENTDLAWLSPYTTTFSAINSWIGEEVRNLGVEAGPTLRLGETQARLFGTVTRGNDPNGTLLAWRGFALHDRVSGFGDRLPLPPLSSFRRPDLFPEQAPFVQPLREVDMRWTWSSGLSLTHPRYKFKALYQPKTANSVAFDGTQYAWRTGYLSAGGAVSFGPVEFLAQGLEGETRMGVGPQNRDAVTAKFRSAYVLASWRPEGALQHRTTLRYDVFEVRDRDDFQVWDPNDESGTAWTFAYAFAPTPRHRITAELLRVNSTRTNRRDLGQDARATEILASLSWRVMF